MKTITFEGKQYEVPDWAVYVARDSGGAVYCYEEMPAKGMTGWFTSYGASNLIEPIGYDWEGSLTEV